MNTDSKLSTQRRGGNGAKRVFAWLAMAPLAGVLFWWGWDDFQKHRPSMLDILVTGLSIFIVVGFFAGLFWLAGNGAFKDRR